jgi:hypothetical protein
LKKHKHVDRNGNTIRVGDIVRIIGIPDLSGMHCDNFSETKLVFEYLVGKYKRVSGFDAYGCAELSFTINQGAKRSWHSVSIEPTLLHIPRQRKT